LAKALPQLLVSFEEQIKPFNPQTLKLLNISLPQQAQGFFVGGNNI
jgi:hypothetical protein